MSENMFPGTKLFIRAQMDETPVTVSPISAALYASEATTTQEMADSHDEMLWDYW